MRTTTRRSMTSAATAVFAAALLGLPAGAAHAIPGDPLEPGDCASKVSGTLTANQTSILRGGSVTVSWVGTVTSALCLDAVTFRVGTSILTSTQENRVGSKIYRPTTGTTLHLYAMYGTQFRSIASRHISIIGEIPFRAEVTSLRVIRAEESGGDEPYLMMFPFVFDGQHSLGGQLSRPDVRMLTPTGRHGMLGSCAPMSAGRTCPVPASIGQWNGVIQPYQNGMVEDGGFGVGLLIVAMEEDATSSDEMIRIRGLVRDVAQDNLRMNRDVLHAGSMEAYGNRVTLPVISTINDELYPRPYDTDDLINAHIVAVDRFSLNGPVGTRIEKVMTFESIVGNVKYEVRVAFTRR